MKKATPSADVRSHHRLLKFEPYRAPLLPRKLFYKRVGHTGLWACAALTAALGIGVIGYKFTEHMSWIDAFANAAMILSGMGPVSSLQTNVGKFFAGCYALFSGLAFITIAGFLLSPFVHRMFHKFHLTEEDPKEQMK